MEFLIVSGMSGAGKSAAAAVLEDMGYYCVDNMPMELVSKFAELCISVKGRYEKVALVIDVRAGGNFEELFRAMDSFKKEDCAYKTIFLEASKPVLIRRFKETRRRHPLEKLGLSIEEIIDSEAEMLQTVRKRADYIIDTTQLTTSGLIEMIGSIFSGEDRLQHSMAITVMSFGFKYGIPMDADLVFDVRFMPNPYYEESLRHHTGMEKEVATYVMDSARSHEFLKKLFEMTEFLIPNYAEEGKTSLVIAIGCTGGRHRSVTVAEKLAEHITGMGYYVSAIHRDAKR